MQTEPRITTQAFTIFCRSLRRGNYSYTSIATPFQSVQFNDKMASSVSPDIADPP